MFGTNLYAHLVINKTSASELTGKLIESALLVGYLLADASELIRAAERREEMSSLH